MQRLIILAVTGMMVLTMARPSQAVTDDEVRQAIARLVNSILNSQNGQGNWEQGQAAVAGAKQNRDYGGYTAIALYALLSAEVEWQKNPKMERALEFLQKVEITGTYARGLSAHVFAKLPESMFGKDLEEDYYWLEEAFHPDKGGYAYEKPAGHFDNSVTQYGVLGMWECAKRGHYPQNDYWLNVEKRMLSMQHPDGGWSYIDKPPSYGSMTTSGLALLYISLHYAHAADFVTPGKTDDHEVMKSINKGLEWMAKNYTPANNPGKGGWDAYWRVGVERVGLASGYKYFGNKDWYKTGAELLVKQGGGGGRAVVDPAFNLIFLSRGRVPVLINKLKIDGYEWNNRPFDVSNLTSWASDEIERSVNWQVIPIETKPQEWLDAPLLWLSGHKRLELTDQQKRKLLTYVALGGTLITHADNSSREFTNSVQQLCKDLWPQYTLGQIPLDDWIYNVNYKVKQSQGFMSINNGVRHMLIHIPKDVGATLQRNDYSGAKKPVWETLVNIYHYATERGRIRPRLETHYEYLNDGAGGPLIRVGLGQYQGNWNPEPGAWLNQSIYMANRKKVTLSPEPVALEEMGDCGMSMVHIAGTEDAKFTDKQIAGLKQYIANGGIVFFESVGGKLAFSDSVMRMLKKAYPKRMVSPLDTRSSVVTGSGFNGFNCSRVKYRAFYKMRGVLGNQPQLQAMDFDGKPRIILSVEDITAGMVNQPMWGIYGYASESAQRLMANATLWAAQEHPSQPKPAEEPAEPPADGGGDKGGADQGGDTGGTKDGGNQTAPAPKPKPEDKKGDDLEDLFKT